MTFSSHPLIENLEDLSEEDMQSKITDLYKKLSIARSLGNAHLAHQIQLALTSYQTAYQDKIKKNPDNDFNSVIDIS